MTSPFRQLRDEYVSTSFSSRPVNIEELIQYLTDVGWGGMCLNCGSILVGKQTAYCSTECANEFNKTIIQPHRKKIVMKSVSLDSFDEK